MQIQLTSEITEPYSTTSVISGLFYTHAKYDKKITRSRRGIWHGTRTVKYYCKNMKYRINIYIYSILHILTIVFHGTRTVEYQPIFHGVT